MLLTATEKRDNRKFQIVAKTPSWRMAKYVLIEKYDVLFPGKDKDVDAKAVSEVYGEIVHECVEGWREITNVHKTKIRSIPWNEKVDDLPSPVIAGVAIQLIILCKQVADVQIETEKK